MPLKPFGKTRPTHDASPISKTSSVPAPKSGHLMSNVGTPTLGPQPRHEPKPLIYPSAAALTPPSRQKSVSAVKTSIARPAPSGNKPAREIFAPPLASANLMKALNRSTLLIRTYGGAIVSVPTSSLHPTTSGPSATIAPSESLILARSHLPSSPTLSIISPLPTTS